MNRATLFLALIVTFYAAVLHAAEKTLDPATSDPKALAISKKVMTALGGTEAWNNAHFLRFDFASVKDGKSNRIRSHWWDKYSGRHRVEGTTKEGDPWVVLHNLNTREGVAYKKGVKQEGEEAKKMLGSAYGVWINDTYWLLMPFKLNDPGVILRYDGRETIEGKSYDKLLLTFDNVGLTPKDKYWAYVNRRTHLVDRWAFVLKGEEEPASHYWWRGWKKYGKVKLAPERAAVDGDGKLLFENLAVSDSMPDSVFTSVN